MAEVMLPLLAIASIIFGTGFGGGYLVRHQISRKRHREAARRYGYSYR